MGQWSAPSFDRHAFAGHRKQGRAVSATTGISFQDYGSMHVVRRAKQRVRRLPTPIWAANDKDLAEVVLKYCERRLYIVSPRNRHVTPESLTHQQRLERIRNREKQMLASQQVHLREQIKRYREMMEAGASEQELTNVGTQIQNLDAQVRTARDSGCAALATSIAYLYHRNGWGCVEVAQELCLKPPLVRQTLARMNMAAADAIYRCPSELRRRAERDERKRLRDLEPKQQILMLRKAEQKVHQQRCAGGTKQKWTRDRILVMYLLRLGGASWETVAARLGCKCVGSVQSAYRGFITKGHEHRCNWRR